MFKSQRVKNEKESLEKIFVEAYLKLNKIAKFKSEIKMKSIVKK